jgi:hypothetical protein
VSVLALAVSALFLPGFVMPAEADTTTSTSPSPAPAPPGEGDLAPIAPAAGDVASAGGDAAPAAGDVASAGRLLVTLPWGDGPGQVGRARAEEGLTRGPEALAVAPDRRIAILDSVNSRLVLLASDGSFTGTFPVDLSQPRFLAVDDELLYVLDADTDRRLVSLDWQGAVAHEADIPVLSDVVTGLFSTDDGPCIEVAHDGAYLVALSDGKGPGKVAKRGALAALREIPGRPIDRKLEKAAKATFNRERGLNLKSFRVDKKSLRATHTESVSPTPPAGRDIEHVVSLDGDGRGGLIVGARILRQRGGGAGEPSLLVGRLPGGGENGATAGLLIDTLMLDDCPFAYLGQPYVVGPDGRVYQPVGSDSGYAIQVHSLPAAAGAAKEVRP